MTGALDSRARATAERMIAAYGKATSVRSMFSGELIATYEVLARG